MTGCQLPTSKSWKNLLAEKILLADQRQSQYDADWTIPTHQQPAQPVYEVWLFELAVIGTILWKATLSERYQHQQPAHVKFVCSSSYKYYLICYEKQKDTGKLGKLYSRKKASMRKWKSENETENANTSYL